jgi:hypothetical protein
MQESMIEARSRPQYIPASQNVAPQRMARKPYIFA